jgi:hypothetical protein
VKPQKPHTVFTPAPATWSGHEHQSNLILDLGFYQASIISNVDFGLTLKNITGYSWHSSKPAVQSVRDTVDSDLTIHDSSYYVDIFEKSREWIPSRYKTLSVGIVYHAPVKQGTLHLAFPLDIEILGLFDKKMKHTFAFKGGIEALFAGRFSLRLGYARAPGILLKGISQIKNLNFFTGGGGIRIDPLVFDFYITYNAFGTTLMFDY